MLKQAYSLLSGTSPDMTKELTEIADKVYSGDLKKLSEKEKIQAISDGKKKASEALTTDFLLSGAAGSGVWAVAKKLAKKGVGKVVEGATATAGAVSSVTLAGAAAITSAMFVLGGFCYNQFYVLPLSNKLRNLIEVHKDIFFKVRYKVLDHKWIGNNVLVTATSTDSLCMNGYADFHNVTGVNFNKPKKAIDWEFAKSECMFLGQDNDDCRKEALRVINCLQENQDDPSLCAENSYYPTAKINKFEFPD